MTACTKLVAAGVVALAALAAWPGGAGAQEMSLAAMIDRLDRMERDLGAVQRQLAREGVPPAAVGEAAGGGGPQLGPRQEVRIAELEEQIRGLTGQVEEAQHRLRQLAEEYNALAEDVDSRLAAIEQRLAAGGPPLVAGLTGPAAAPAAAMAAPGMEGTTTVVDAEGTTVVGGDPNRERYESMGVLGTVAADEAAEAAGTELAAVPAPPGIAPLADTPEGRYEDAYRLLAQADYDAAEAALQAFIAGHPDHALAGNAYYWLGETYYVRNDFQQAAVAFARGYKGAPEGSKAADNLLKLGMSFTAMDKTQEACATFDKLLRDHADAPAQVLSRVNGERSRAGCG